MGLRFAILKTVSKGAEEIALEYREDQLCERLQARVWEKMSQTETVRVIKHRWPKKDEVLVKNTWDKVEAKKFLAEAFHELINEFKEETVKIT